MSHARLTGLVTHIGPPRSGTSDNGRAWANTTATVLVGGVSTTEFSFDHTRDIAVREMDSVDILVELGSYNGRPQLRFAGIWNDAKASLLADTLAAAG